jgi:gamma-butyrobetaine dioxygenase
MHRVTGEDFIGAKGQAMDVAASSHVAPGRRGLDVVLPDGTRHSVHPLWLRERVTDAANVDAATGQRLYNPSDLDTALRVTQVEEPAPGRLTVSFTDGASGDFSAAEILQAWSNTGDTALPAARPWSNADAAPAAHDWRLCSEAEGRLAVLRDYLTHGYAMLRAVPREGGAVLDVARCFGFPRETNFGVLFDVRSVPKAADLAYTPLPLDPHTDNPYRQPVPGIQLLHCITNETPGGLSTLVDGLAVAASLRRDAPQDFASLASVQVRFRYTDTNTDLVAWAPMIALDAAGGFSAIHYSPRLDFVELLPEPALEVFYAARRRLDRMLKSERFERRFRLADGDVMMFNNRRLLHGRTGFDPGSGLRHLQGCYIDADGPESLYRVLVRSVA